MKNIETIKSIVLSILVGISLVLTYFQWIYQPSNEEIDSDKLVDPVEIADELTPGEVIAPAQVLFHRNGTTYGTGDIKKIMDMYANIKMWNFSETRDITAEIPEDEFLNLVHGDGSVEFIFNDDVPLQLFSQIQGFSEEGILIGNFDRMVLDMGKYDENNLKVYFISYFGEERRIYATNASGAAIKQFQTNYYNQTPEGFNAYTYYDVDERQRIYYPISENNNIRMNSYKFFRVEVDIDLFKNALFSEPDNVKRRSLNGREEYNDSSSLMIVEDFSKKLSYVDPANEPDTSIPLSDLLEEGIGYINDHKGWTDRYIYSSWSPVQNKVSFILYYEGYPVYNNQVQTTIDIFLGDEGIYQYNRPYFALDIRLENQTAEVYLPSGEVVIKEILEKIEGEELQALRLGYKYDQDPQKPYVSLEPTWFYLYAGTWLPFNNDDQGGELRGLE